MSINRLSFSALLLAGMLLPSLPAAANDREGRTTGGKAQAVQETYAGTEDTSMAPQAPADTSHEATPRVIHGYENH
jgi:hypothetical protein